MASVALTKASLRFFGDDLNPEELTRLLGSPPTEFVRKGQIRPSGFVERAGSWRLKAADRHPGDLDRQIVSLLGGLTPDLAVWVDLATRYDGDLFCGLFMEQGNEGLVLSPTTLAAISARGLRLSLDIYDPTAD